VSDFCLTTNEHFLTISLQELAAFGEMLLMLMISGLYWTNSRSCFFYSSSSLPQQSAGNTHYFDSNQPVLWDAANTNFIVLGLTRPGREPTICHIRGEHAHHFTTEAVDDTVICIDKQVRKKEVDPNEKGNNEMFIQHWSL